VQNWKRRKRRSKADLEATLEKEKADLEEKVFELEWRPCKDCIENELGYKEIYDLYKGELQQDMQQCGKVLELEEENEKLMDHRWR
jgi:hypothetical protein